MELFENGKGILFDEQDSLQLARERALYRVAESSRKIPAELLVAAGLVPNFKEGEPLVAAKSESEATREMLDALAWLSSAAAAEYKTNANKALPTKLSTKARRVIIERPTFGPDYNALHNRTNQRTKLLQDMSKVLGQLIPQLIPDHD